MGRAIDTDSARQIVMKLLETVTGNYCALVSLVRLKTASDFTYMHSVAVCVLMVVLARQLGFDRDQSRASELVGLLHDSGKATLPLEVLHESGKLDNSEFAIMQRHAEEGSRILKSCGIQSAALDVCLNHHARIDGAGYRHSINGNDIGVYSRMASVCDEIIEARKDPAKWNFPDLIELWSGLSGKQW